MIEELMNAARSLIGAIAESKLPPVIEELYEPGSSAFGTLRGRWLLRKDDNGFRYEHQRADRGYEPQPAVAGLEVHHRFDDLASLSEYQTKVLGSGGFPTTFVQAKPFLAATAVMLIDPSRPERGDATLSIARHPEWLRWSSVAGRGAFVDLTHEQLADLLIDNAESLEEPMIAKVIAAFRSARTIEYTGDLDTGGSQGVKVTYSSGSTAKAGEVKVPREFSASFPAYSGVWAPMTEPCFTAKFRLRVMQPKKDDAAPVFRIIWINALDFEFVARDALFSKISKELATDDIYLGEPKIIHRIMPNASASSAGA